MPADAYHAALDAYHGAHHQLIGMVQVSMLSPELWTPRRHCISSALRAGARDPFLGVKAGRLTGLTSLACMLTRRTLTETS
jgi:hypothetical protein